MGGSPTVNSYSLRRLKLSSCRARISNEATHSYLRLISSQGHLLAFLLSLAINLLLFDTNTSSLINHEHSLKVFSSARAIDTAVLPSCSHLLLPKPSRPLNTSVDLSVNDMCFPCWNYTDYETETHHLPRRAVHGQFYPANAGYYPAYGPVYPHQVVSPSYSHFPWYSPYRWNDWQNTWNTTYSYNYSFGSPWALHWRRTDHY
jgi:hypothetical protein